MLEDVDGEPSEYACSKGASRPGCQSLLSAVNQQDAASVRARRAQRVTHSEVCFSLFEVEAVLRRHPSVRELLAFAMPHTHGTASIGVAVVLHRGARTVEVSELRSFGSAARLTPRMLPEAVTCVDNLPSGATGSANRLGLVPMLDLSAAETHRRHWYRVPSSLPECEALICDTMASAGGVSPGSGARQRPFLDLGIDSLQGELFVRRLNLQLAPLLELRPTAIYDHPSVRQLAQFILAQLQCESTRVAAGQKPSTHTLDPTPRAAAMVGTSGKEIGRVGLLSRAVRAPGAPSAAHLFSLAASGGDSLLQVPGMRWSTGACAPSNAMCTSCRHGGFVPGAQRFDHVRFEISPSEARAMDPQQRLLLEVAYSSTHDAELRRSDLISCDAGVFVGIMNTDFEKLLAGQHE